MSHGIAIGAGFCLLPLLAWGAGEANVLANPGFDDGLTGWQTNAAVVMEAVNEGGRTAARMVVPKETAVSWPMFTQEHAAAPGDMFEASVEALGKDVCDGYGVYAAIEFHNAQGERLCYQQTPCVTGEDQWTELQVRSIAPPGAAAARWCLILNGHGEARFDNAKLCLLRNVAPGPLAGAVTLTVTDEVVCDSLIGFGAEDDGWFYNPENAAHGVTEADVRLRETRIEWMDPDWVRMFFWYNDWNPSVDWATFTFDSPNMQSHYRTLDLYQRIGAVIDVTGVEWGMADPYGQPDKAAAAIGALFEHLIRAKGYSCVQQWTLTNEPNGYFASKYKFERFVELHLRVKEEFARRGLAVQIVGSDDTSGLPWFTQCVQDERYFGLADLFVSHHYVPFADRVLASFLFEDRLRLLAGKSPKKPFAVAEFGFQDARSATLENPLMESYPYALWTAAFIIEGLNRGVAGFSIWCLHEVYYPGNGFMNYALWDFKDENWKLRPVYHAFANFTRQTERGDPVRRCTSTHPQHVNGAVVGKTLFWVNGAKEPADVRVAGFPIQKVRVMTADSLAGEGECGAEVKPVENRFAVPPESFGYAQ